MQIHQVIPKHKKKSKKRVGRGGKRGTYSGKGIKGQKARSGANMQPIVRELIKRYPKLKGFRHKGKAFRSKPFISVNLSLLEKSFKDGEFVSPKSLIKKGIIEKIKGKIPLVKILGKGELKKKLIIQDCFVSKKAKEKIIKSQGEIR